MLPPGRPLTVAFLDAFDGQNKQYEAFAGENNTQLSPWPASGTGLFVKSSRLFTRIGYGRTIKVPTPRR